MRIGGGGAKITAGSQRHVSLVQRTLAERPCIQSGTGNVEVGIERAVRLHFDRQSDALQTINYDAPTAQQLLTAGFTLSQALRRETGERRMLGGRMRTQVIIVCFAMMRPSDR